MFAHLPWRRRAKPLHSASASTSTQDSVFPAWWILRSRCCATSVRRAQSREKVAPTRPKREDDHSIRPLGLGRRALAEPCKTGPHTIKVHAPILAATTAAVLNALAPFKRGSNRASPLRRSAANHSAKHSRHVGLVGEAATSGHAAQHAAVADKLLRARHALRAHEGARGHVQARSELAANLEGAGPADLAQLGQRHLALKVVLQVRHGTGQ